MQYEASLINDQEDGERNMILINLQTPMQQLHYIPTLLSISTSQQSLKQINLWSVKKQAERLGPKFHRVTYPQVQLRVQMFFVHFTYLYVQF